MNPKTYLASRKIHRLLVVFVTVLGLVMAGTGTVMRFPSLLPQGVGAMVEIHETVSVFFAAILVLQIITGLVLYVFPLIRKPKKGQS